VAISIDYATKVITIPQADCTFVSGTFYRLPTETVFRAQVNALMDNEAHMWMPDPIDHNTEYTVAGATYARKIEIINGYSVTFTPDSQWTVELTESNNNLFDVGNGILNQNQVQVIPTNSAGLITVVSGSGVTEQDKTDIVNQTWAKALEGAVTAEQMMRVIAAVLWGKASGMDTNSPVFRSIMDTKDRVTATTDANGNRTSVTMDGS